MRRVAALALLAALASCAKPAPPKPVTEAPPRPVIANTVFRGVARLVTQSSPFCPRSGPRSLQVQNGTITLSYQAEGRRRVPLTATIQPDGTFSTSDGVGRLSGQLANGNLQMTIVSPYCEHFYSMRPRS